MALLSDVKKSIPVTAPYYDERIAGLIETAVYDLRIAGIPVEGVSLKVQDGTVSDQSYLSDPLLRQAIVAYVRAHFGSPEDYDRLKAAYDEQKAQLQVASGYGMEDAYV